MSFGMLYWSHNTQQHHMVRVREHWTALTTSSPTVLGMTANSRQRQGAGCKWQVLIRDRNEE